MSKKLKLLSFGKLSRASKNTLYSSMNVESFLIIVDRSFNDEIGGDI